MSESLVRGVFKVAIGFVVVTLVLLAGTLYASKYYLQQQQRLAAAGDVPGALEAARVAARVSPFDSEPVLAESNLLVFGGQKKAALKALEEATRRDPANSVNFVSLGNFYLGQMDDPESAVRAYREAIERVPKATNVRSLLAAALAGSGDLEGAKREYEELVELGRITQQDRFELGGIYTRTGEPEKALEALRATRERATNRLDEGEESKRAQKEAFVQSLDLAIVDALVVQGDYEGAAEMLQQSSSPQAPALLELLSTNPEQYRQRVLESEV